MSSGFIPCFFGPSCNAKLNYSLATGDSSPDLWRNTPGVSSLDWPCLMASLQHGSFSAHSFPACGPHTGFAIQGLLL